MGFCRAGRGRVWRGVGCVALVWAGVASGATTRTGKRPVVLSAWEQAQKARASLEEQAEGTRTKAGYARVLDGYRTIYHDNPGDSHAAEAVFAVAEVLAEEGREFEDQKSLKAAVGQYEFLRTQYPGSGLRGAALLAEGKIEAEDLGDKAAAKEKFQAVVKESPRSESGRAARGELAGLSSEGRGKSHPSEPRTLARDSAREEGREGNAISPTPTHRDDAVMNGAQGVTGAGETKSVPQGLKPASLPGADGTAEAVPTSKGKAVMRLSLA